MFVNKIGIESVLFFFISLCESFQDHVNIDQLKRKQSMVLREKYEICEQPYIRDGNKSKESLRQKK